MATLVLGAAVAWLAVAAITYKPPQLRCICTQEYRPVCDKNKVKYSNPCMARCAGVTVFTECTQPKVGRVGT